MHSTATPFFPSWSNRLNPMGSRTAKALRSCAALTLCQLESCFSAWLPSTLLPKPRKSRDRDYTCPRTFWCMLWQAFNPLASGREVVRQLQALFEVENQRQLSCKDGAYCRAKARLPLKQFPKVLDATAHHADALIRPTSARLQGRPLKVVDGSTVTLQDTPKNRHAYPPVTCGSFPMMRFVALFSLLSGSIIAVAQGAWTISELALLHLLELELRAGDILVGDRGFGSFPVAGWLQLLHIDFIGRTKRRIDGRKCIQRLGRNDWLMQWKKTCSCLSPWLTPSQRAALPAAMMVRAVKGSCYQKGFRARQFTVITTLLDPKLYPAHEILQAYLQRWRMELCLDDLKTTLQMEFLRARTPEMICREMYARLIAHNLIRCTMAQAAVEYHVPFERLSFKGCLDAVRHFTHAMARARSRIKRQKLWELLLDTLARDKVPDRPGRREPRAAKRQYKKYPRLNAPRHKFRDRLKRNVRATISRRRKLGLM